MFDPGGTKDSTESLEYNIFEGCDSLSKEASSLSLYPVPLDVTKDESVTDARKIVGEKLGDKRYLEILSFKK